jgi:acetyltransferase-like isoleucine patch superfamily enzyme
MISTIIKYFSDFYLKYWFHKIQKECENVVFGSNIKFHGRPDFSFNKKSKVELGDNLVFTSSIMSNWAGLYKKSSVAVMQNANLKIGNNCKFSGISLYCSNKIIIGEYVICGANVSIWDTDFHPIDYIERRISNTEARTKPVTIGNDVFIGANAIILKGSKIGERSIIAAGSVVSGKIPPDQIWGGNPAKFLLTINHKK